jgi:RecA/RadA recombinase
MSSDVRESDIFEFKLSYVFNKFLLDFVRAVNSSASELKTASKKNYRIIDKQSTEFLQYADAVFEDNVMITLKGSAVGDILDSEPIKQLCVLKELSVGQIKDQGNDAMLPLLRAYLYTFALLVQMKRSEIEVDASVSSKNLSRMLEIIKSIQHHTFTAETLDEIMDEDYKLLLVKLHESEQLVINNNNRANTQNKEDVTPDKMFESLENTMIGNLAKEISEEIDISSLKIEKPEDILNLANFENLAKGENTVIGSIVSKVGSKIQSKLRNGELKQDQLLSEAFGFMNTLSGAASSGNSQGAQNPLSDIMNNPMMKNIFASMTGMGGGHGTANKSHMQMNDSKVRESKTRDRLRKKAEERRSKPT